MKTLVAYYSRTGSNKAIGQLITKGLGADSDEIIDLKNREGVIGWLKSGSAAVRRGVTEIKCSKDPTGYDRIVIGGPIWAGHITPAMRSYITTHDLSGKRLAFFFVSGQGDAKGALEDLQGLLPGTDLSQILSLPEQEFKSGQHEEKVKDFIARMGDR